MENEEHAYQDPMPTIFVEFGESRAWDVLCEQLMSQWFDFKGSWTEFGKRELAECFTTILSDQLVDAGQVSVAVEKAIQGLQDHVQEAVSAMTMHRADEFRDPEKKIAALQEAKKKISYVVPTSYANIPRKRKVDLATLDHSIRGDEDEEGNRGIYRYNVNSSTTTMELLSALELMINKIARAQSNPYTYNVMELRSSEVVVYMYLVLCFYEGLTDYIETLQAAQESSKKVQHAHETVRHFEEKSRDANIVAENYRIGLFNADLLIQMSTTLGRLSQAEDERAITMSQLESINRKLDRLLVGPRR